MTEFEWLMRPITPGTITVAIALGVVVGVIWKPALERATGALAIERRIFFTFASLEVAGLAFFTATMVARMQDGVQGWAAWLGTALLWSLMATSATIARRISGR